MVGDFEIICFKICRNSYIGIVKLVGVIVVILYGLGGVRLFGCGYYRLLGLLCLWSLCY